MEDGVSLNMGHRLGRCEKRQSLPGGEVLREDSQWAEFRQTLD